jgi:hypothetical protein
MSHIVERPIFKWLVVTDCFSALIKQPDKVLRARACDNFTLPIPPSQLQALLPCWSLEGKLMSINIKRLSDVLVGGKD